MVGERYTKVSKWLMQVAITRNLSPRHLSILFFYVEKTCGFNRENFKAAPKEIAEATGMHVQHVYGVLRELLAGGYLLESDEGISVPGIEPGGLSDLNRNGTKNNRNGLNRNGTNFEPKRYKKTTETVQTTGVNSSDDAASGKAKKTSKKTSKKTPLPPEGEERISDWFDRVWSTLVLRKVGKDAAKSIAVRSMYDADTRKRIEKYMAWLNESRDWMSQEIDRSGKKPIEYYPHLRTIFHQKRYNDPIEETAPAKPAAPSLEEKAGPNPWAGAPWERAWFHPGVVGCSSMREKIDWLAGKFKSEGATHCDPLTAYTLLQEQGDSAAMAYVWEFRPRRKEA